MKVLNTSQKAELKAMLDSMSNDYGISFNDAVNFYTASVAKNRKLSMIDKELMIVEVTTLRDEEQFKNIIK